MAAPLRMLARQARFKLSATTCFRSPGQPLVQTGKPSPALSPTLAGWSPLVPFDRESSASADHAGINICDTTLPVQVSFDTMVPLDMEVMNSPMLCIKSSRDVRRWKTRRRQDGGKNRRYRLKYG
eukprot:gnl/TRDRNA2_/TRDRNA2_84881_c0_seq1.p1 gnl/TRDRNA2_/TRDRNA2_84881_c0~~gnl/TRDRNA2_/TRDRNA2_84881_c0_seq1.p1  ORF type:complete len:145 (+),score=13.50 gnl/TRDRNA2_/TRDRNA2_84881_c0_seq1:61-435(+)